MGSEFPPLVFLLRELELQGPQEKKKEREVAEVEGPALTCAETKGRRIRSGPLIPPPQGRSTCLVRDFVINCRFFNVELRKWTEFDREERLRTFFREIFTAVHLNNFVSFLYLKNTF